MQTRELALGKPDPQAHTVPVVLSTETPVDRLDYIEVLDHSSPTSVDLSRAPLPLIESHDQQRLPIGIVDNLRVEGRKLRGVARFGNSQRAQEVFADVQAGILRSVSVGYEYVGKPTPQGEDVLRFKFRPLEVSAVSVPADPNAGFFRSHPTMNPSEDNITPMTRSQRRALREDQQEQLSAVEAERSRIAEITALFRVHRVQNDTLRDKLIREGASVEHVKAVILELVLARGEAQASLSGYGHVPSHSEPDMNARERGRYSLSRAILGAADKDWRNAGFEREVSGEIARRVGRDTAGLFVPLSALVPQRRDYNTLTGSAGGALVQTELAANSFIELLRNKSRVINLGANAMSALVGNIDIPRRTAAGAAQWINEGQSLTPSTGSFDTVRLSPKTIGSLSVISRNLLIQGTPDAEMLIRSDMIAQLAIAIDAAAINGSGTGAEPRGLLNLPGVQSVAGGTNGAPITFDHLIALSTAVAAANADSGALGFLSNPQVLGALSRLKSTTGEYLWANRGGAGNENSAPALAIAGATASGDAGFSILGYQAGFTNNVPSNLTKGTASNCSAVIFGNWKDLLIGEWGALEILPNPYASGAYEAGAVQVRALQTIDIAVRHPESFAIMRDALTA